MPKNSSLGTIEGVYINSYIFTEYGYRKASEACPGYFRLLNKDGLWSSIKSIAFGKRKPLVIHAKNRNPLLVAPEQKLLVCHKNNGNGSISWQKANDNLKGCFLVTPSAFQFSSYQTNGSALFDTDDFYYFMGVYCGVGIDDHANQKIAIDLRNNPQQAFMTEIIKRTFAFYSTKYPNDKKPLYHFFQSSFIDKKKERKIPNWLFRASERQKAFFLKGYSDSEPMIDSNPRLAENILLLAEMSGYSLEIVTTARTNTPDKKFYTMKLAKGHEDTLSENLFAEIVEIVPSTRSSVDFIAFELEGNDNSFIANGMVMKGISPNQPSENIQ